MTESEHAGVEEIHVIDNSAYVPKVIPTYVALGFLAEYAGRNLVEGGEIVETLFPSERQHVRGFVSILQDIAGEQNIATHIRQEVQPSGHIAIISRELTAYLDSLYLPMLDDASNFTNTNGRKRRSMRARIRAEMFPEIRSREYKPDEVDCRFSFLLGCHIRYGTNNSFKLANAPHKVQLIVEFLERLGASWIKWSWTIGTAPVGHRIDFGPDAVLSRFLELIGDFGTWE